VPTAWTVRDSKGQLLPHFVAGSRLEVARKVVPTHYDAFRLQVSSSYRAMFNRDLKVVLEREVWQIVPITRRSQLYAQANVVAANKCSVPRSSVDRPNEPESQLDRPFFD
jgi:hypothetical protein